MSQVSTAAGLDWNIVAAAVATFVGTLIVTIFGWYKGRERIQRRLSTPEIGGNGMLAGAVLQDNQSLRDATVASRELRDQMLLTHEALDRHSECLRDNSRHVSELVEEFRRARFKNDRQEKA